MCRASAIAALVAAATVLAAATLAPAQPSGQTPKPATTPTTAAAPASQPASQPAGGLVSPPRPRGFLESLAAGLGKLHVYFGLVGVASVFAWVLAWGLMAAFSLRTPGMPACLATALLAGLAVVYAASLPQAGEFVLLLLWLAILPTLVIIALCALLRRQMPLAFGVLVLALAAFGLAQWNSDNVSAIEPDRTDQLQAARQRQLQARRRQHDANAKAGRDDINYTGAAGGAATTRPASDEPNAPAGEYDYRKAGKKARDPNKLAKTDELTAPVEKQAREDESLAAGARTLPDDQLLQANQFDRLNLFAVRLTLVVALLLAVVEYLRRFNFTFGSIFPLPVACRAIDSLWPKTHAVHLRTARIDAVRHFLETAVQKGETFIYFAPADPWAGGTPALSRLPVRGPWRLKKITCPAGDPAYSPQLIFESAWFGRYCFVILAEAAAERLAVLLDDFLTRLRMRKRTHATAATTVNLIWHVPTDLNTPVLAELADLCRETNLKLVVVSPTAPVAGQAGVYEETLTA